MTWFLECLGRALQAAEHTLSQVLVKARFWERHQQIPFTERQRQLLTRLLDGFEGKFTTTKWARMAHCSQGTAGRDIADLVAKGVLVHEGAGGRNTSYCLAPETHPSSIS